MERRTIISLVLLLVAVCLLLGFSMGDGILWPGSLFRFVYPASISLIMTLLVGLVLMDSIFELDSALVIRVKRSRIKVEIKQYLVLSFVIVITVSLILEVVQFCLSRSTVNWVDPLAAFAGSVVGITLHVIGSKLLMKRVEFELERWEDNVL